jgi:hypothetical protein
MSETAKALVWSAVIMGAIVGVVWLTESIWPAHGAGHSDDPAIQRWFDEDVVKRCCSKADGFEADDYDSAQGGVWATITDDGHQVCWEYYDEEDDTRGETCRRPVPDVRRIFVPDDKIIFSPRNPTGHGFLFVDHQNKPRCYFLPSGA